MPHLTCVEHKRRCWVFDQNVVRHKSGSPECNSSDVSFGGVKMPKGLITVKGVPKTVRQVSQTSQETAPKRKSRQKRGQ